MKNFLRGGFVAVVMAAAVWAVGCESTRSPARPSTADSSRSLAFTALPSSASNAPLTIAWHCFAASVAWQAADCPPAGGTRVNASASASLTTPGVPSNLTATVSSARVTLSWLAPGGGDQPTSYVVEAGSATGRVDLANFDTGTSALSLVVDNVPAGTYFVRVRAKNPAGVSGPSNEFVLTVTGAGACLPSAPGNLAVSASGSTVTLQWTGSAGACAPTGYIVEAGSAPGAANLANFNTGNTATTFVAPNVGAGTYFVRVRGSNAAGASAPSNEATLVVSGGGCAGVPGAPAGLNASVNGSTVSLSWGGVAGATSYVLEAGSGPGLANLLASDQGPATSLTATANNGTYFVRVKAKNACGTSGPSNEVVVTVGSSAPGCAFTVSPASQTIINDGGNSTVNVSTSSGCAWSAVSNSSFITISSGASGSGNGTVSFSVAGNPTSTPRIGTLTVAGQTVTVTQGATCTFSLSATSISRDAIGGNVVITVTPASSTCQWAAQSNASFVTVAAGSSGTGTGSVTLNLRANPNVGGQRSGTATVAGQTVTISQDGALPALTRGNGCPAGGKSPAPDDTSIQFINNFGNTTITVSPLDANGATVGSTNVTPSTGFKADTKVDTVFQVTANGCLYFYTAVAGGKSAVVQ